MALEKFASQTGNAADTLAAAPSYLSGYQTALQAGSTPYAMTKILGSNDYARTQATQTNTSQMPEAFVPGEGDGPPGVSGDALGSPMLRAQHNTSLREQRGDAGPERMV